MTSQPTTAHRPPIAEFILVLLGIAVVYGLLFNQMRTPSLSIGYNVQAAERVFLGEVPYRDFYTIYPPAIFWINASLFRLFGVSLYASVLGVYVFKTLTLWFVHLSARRVMPRMWAVAATASALIWLRPSGAFKPIPMHYGALFLAIGLFGCLSYLYRRDSWKLAAAGLSFGLLALCKHNIGAYSLAAFGAFLVVDAWADRAAAPLWPGVARRWGLLAVGFFPPVLATLGWMYRLGALPQMIDKMIHGPADFLEGRTISTPSPVAALVLVAVVGLALFLGKIFHRGGAETQRREESGFSPRLRVSAVNNFFRSPGAMFWTLVAVGAACFAAFGPRETIDTLIFYFPVLVAVACVGGAVFLLRAGDPRTGLAAVALAAAVFAAFMESFPKFVRGQAIAAMPFAVPALFVVLAGFRSWLPAAGRIPALAALPLAVAVVGGQLFYGLYFDEGFHRKCDTELAFERGKRVYFPRKTAREMDKIVRFIQERVPPDKTFFAHSNEAAPYIFLAGRRHLSYVQVWGDIPAVTDTDRAKTLVALDRENIQLVVTTDESLEGEIYAPMRDYLNANFSKTATIGYTVMLERKEDGFAPRRRGDAEKEKK